MTAAAQHRPYAAAPRVGPVEGTGPGISTAYHQADPPLGWCAACGHAWQPDERLPFGDDGAGAPLDHCAQCGAGADSRTGPALWAEWLLSSHPREAWRGRTLWDPPLPAEVRAACPTDSAVQNCQRLTERELRRLLRDRGDVA